MDEHQQKKRFKITMKGIWTIIIVISSILVVLSSLTPLLFLQ